MGSSTAHIRPDPTHAGRALRRGSAALAATTLVALAACSAADDDSAAFDGPAVTEAPAEAPAEEFDGGSDAAEAAEPATGGATSTGGPLDLTFGRDLIVEASVTMLTPDVRAAVDDTLRIARASGGAVFDAVVRIDDPLEDGSIPGSGSITIRIPPDQIDGLIASLRGVGTLRDQTQSVDDVTDQVIDLDVRIAQARASVERMQQLLEGATDFETLVAAETELARRQVDYERLLASQRSLDDRVALATLRVNIEYRAPLDPDAVAEPVEESDDGIADAFRNGWEAFAGVLFGLAFVIAVAAPFLGLLLVLALIAWAASRRLGRHAGSTGAPGAGQPVSDLPAPESERQDALVGSSHED